MALFVSYLPSNPGTSDYHEVLLNILWLAILYVSLEEQNRRPQTLLSRDKDYVLKFS